MVLEVRLEVAGKANGLAAHRAKLVERLDGVGGATALGNHEDEIVLREAILVGDERVGRHNLHVSVEVLHHERLGALRGVGARAARNDPDVVVAAIDIGIDEAANERLSVLDVSGELSRSLLDVGKHGRTVLFGHIHSLPLES